jgi:hypothetical protein
VDVSRGGMSVTGLRWSGVDKTRSAFNQYFSPWGIELPDDAENPREAVIRTAGWEIRYRYDTDGSEKYLEFWARHRMTAARHVKIYEDGRLVYLSIQLADIAHFMTTSEYEAEVELRKQYAELGMREIDVDSFT